MPKVRIKICGITNWTDAKHAIECGATLLGFNFYPPSPRYITPARARRIIRRLPKGISAVGVFANEPEKKIRAVARVAGIACLQLHGEESPEMVNRLQRSLCVMKGIQVKKPFRAAQLAPYKRADMLLLDGFDGRLRGGTGKTFDWKLARAARRYGRIVLAGGLTPENVGQAIRTARPYAVDVCSGVESRPGRKDPARLKAFQHAVREAERGKR